MMLERRVVVTITEHRDLQDKLHKVVSVNMIIGCLFAQCRNKTDVNGGMFSEA
jgi:hypothetical protein